MAGRAEPVEQELNPDVNVIFGLNGTGKTSLLRILNAALRNSDRDLQGVEFGSAKVEFYSHSRDQVITRTARRSSRPRLADDEIHYVDIDGEYVQVQEQRAADPTLWKSNPRTDTTFACSFLSTWRLTGRGLVSPAYYQGPERLDESSLDEVFASHVRQLWRLYSNQTLSDVRQIQNAGLAAVLQTVFRDDDRRRTPHRDIEADVAYERANGFLRRQGVRSLGSPAAFRRRYKEDPKLQHVVDDIDEIERQIEKAEEPRRQLAQLVEDFFGANKNIEFTDRDIMIESLSGKQIPLTGLSAGEKHLLRIVIEVVTAGAATVLIDEPELSLHIDWQRRLLRSLRTLNPEVQLIVATHSPEIMAEIPDDRIIAL